MPKIQVRRGTNQITTQLDVGEFGFKTDTNELAIGKGIGNSPVRISTWKEYSSNYTVLVANVAEIPVALQLGNNTLLGRLNGNIAALTGSDVWSVINGQNSTSINVNNQRIINLSTPVNSTDAVNKYYVDTLVSRGLTFHEAVLDKDLTSPPANPGAGDRYWVAPNATGAWAGKDYKIATYTGADWEYEDVTDGDAAYVTDENLFYFYNADGTGDKRQKLSAGMGPHASTHQSGGTDSLDVKDLVDSGNNLLKNAFTVKGQILVATGNGTWQALSVGADGQVLTADSSQACGVKWATGGGGSSTFIGLTDTPNSYTGYADYFVKVDSTANALEFTNTIDGGTL